MISRIKNILIWLKKNERHFWTALFVGGFATDVVMFLPAPLSRANFLFIIYLGLVILSVLGAHYLFVRKYDQRKGIGARIANVGVPFVGEFFTGALLSGFLIFYSKSSSLFVSWPFILLLFAVFFGNELFRDYRKHLAFQTTLVFFTIYAYTIFSLPLAIKTIGPNTFLESGAVSIGVYLIFLVLLGFLGWKRLRDALPYVISAGVVLTVLINAAYFTGIIPPLPLTLKDSGVYQSITHTDDSYLVTGDPEKPWWDVFGVQIVQITPGSSLSVFSSVFAPIAFSSTIVHRWEIYNDTSHTWVDRAEIAFSMSGGRDDGYRGYSTITNIQPGNYRVLIETLSGQIIGQESFTVEDVSQEPVLVTETK